MNGVFNALSYQTILTERRQCGQSSCYSENKVLKSKANPIFGFREEKVAIILLMEPTLVLVLMKFMKPSV